MEKLRANEKKMDRGRPTKGKTRKRRKSNSMNERKKEKNNTKYKAGKQSGGKMAMFFSAAEERKTKGAFTCADSCP